MIKNKILIVLVLFVGFSPSISFSAEGPGASWFGGYGNRAYNAVASSLGSAKKSIGSAFSTAGGYATGFSDRVTAAVNGWSPRTMIIALGALVVALVGIYGKDSIGQFINKTLADLPDSGVGQSVQAAFSAAQGGLRSAGNVIQEYPRVAGIVGPVVAGTVGAKIIKKGVGIYQAMRIDIPENLSSFDDFEKFLKTNLTSDKKINEDIMQKLKDKYQDKSGEVNRAILSTYYDREFDKSKVEENLDDQRELAIGNYLATGQNDTSIRANVLKAFMQALSKVKKIVQEKIYGEDLAKKTSVIYNHNGNYRKLLIITLSTDLLNEEAIKNSIGNLYSDMQEAGTLGVGIAGDAASLDLKSEDTYRNEMIKELSDQKIGARNAQVGYINAKLGDIPFISKQSKKAEAWRQLARDLSREDYRLDITQPEGSQLKKVGP